MANRQIATENNLDEEMAIFNPEEYTLPAEGIPTAKRNKLLVDFHKRLQDKNKLFLGYQANQKLSCKKPQITNFLGMHVNNIGDPFTEGGFKINSKVMEVKVLDYYARLWHAQIPKDRDKPQPDDYWGYLLSMGSSEGNLYGLWSARDYLAGRKLIINEDSHSAKRQQLYLKPKRRENKNAYKPIAFYSEDSHYSIIKAIRVLGIKSFHDVATEHLNKIKDEDKSAWQNPLEPNLKAEESWNGYETVPSMNGKDGSGSIDVDKLEKLVSFFAEKGYPILLICNYGTTFKGAYDNVGEITARLLPIFAKNGLINREVEWEKGKTDHRDGFWIHLDGALGSAYVPYYNYAIENKMLNATELFPQFDFKLPIASMVMSGHKWAGIPWPCGVYMTKHKFQVYPPDNPEYIGAPDTTFAGSRNGFSAILLWDYLASNSMDMQAKRIVKCLKMVDFVHDQLVSKVAPKHPNMKLKIEKSPLSLTIRFRRPNEKLIAKYSLSCETVNIDGEDFEYAHIFIMDHVDKKVIKLFVDDLCDEQAFKKIEHHQLANEGMGYGFH